MTSPSDAPITSELTQHSERPVAPPSTTQTRKRAKRANGEGSVWHDKQYRRWVGSIVIDGRRYRVTAKTKQEALRRVKELRGSRHQIGGLPQNPSLAEWLHHWITAVVPGEGKRQPTIDSYGHAVRSYINPSIGARKLQSLRPSDVRHMLAELEERGLAPNTRRIALATLRRALRIAEVEGLVERNVAKLVDGVNLDRERGRSLTPEEARRLMTALDECDPLTAALLTTLITTGMRKGECLALRWSDIDLDARTVHVRRVLTRTLRRSDAPTTFLVESTKNESSNRIVELGPSAVAALRKWKTTQAEMRLKTPVEPFGWGVQFNAALGVVQTWPDDLVFTGSRGQALNTSRPGQMLRSVTKKVGLGDWNPHALRHTAASLMLGAGVPITTVSKSLGHASITITLDVYGHLVSGEGRAAADALDAVLTADRSIAATTQSQ